MHVNIDRVANNDVWVKCKSEDEARTYVQAAHAEGYRWMVDGTMGTYYENRGTSDFIFYKISYGRLCYHRASQISLLDAPEIIDFADLLARDKETDLTSFVKEVYGIGD